MIYGRLYKILKKENKDIYNLKYIFFIYFILIIIFILVYFTSNWIKSEDGLKNEFGFIFIVYILVFTVVMIFLLSIIKKKEQNFKSIQIELENLQNYIEKLEDLYMDMRKFKHDYINILSSMLAFIEEDDSNGLRKFFYNKICPLNEIMNNKANKLVLLKNIKILEIKGILAAKIIRAQELGVDTIIDITEPISEIKVDIIDMVISLGIILDNAIEASLESDEKVINIGFIRKNTSVIIVVSNTFKDKGISISKMFKLGISTKGEDRGQGLSNLKEKIGKYRNVTLDTFIEKNIFVQEITIKCK